MGETSHSIPERIAMLMVGFFAKTLTAPEHEELDDWITASPANQKAFEDCLEMIHRPYRPAPDDEEMNDQDEDVIMMQDILYTADLIMKYFKDTLTQDESEYLQQWADSSPVNRQLLDSLPKTDDMEFLCNHLRLRWLDMQAHKHLN